MTRVQVERTGLRRAQLLVKEVESARGAGVRSVILFGVPNEKDSVGSQAYAEDGITRRAIRAVKREMKDVLLIADDCLCEYTDPTTVE